MGSKSSKPSARCIYCGSNTFERLCSRQHRCNRCDGLCGPAAVRINLNTLHCGVILNDLNDDLEEEKLQETLRKHFAHSRAAQVRRGIIFRTLADITFKILHCHPPAGIVTRSTSIFVTGPTGSLIRLNTSRKVRRLDIRPTRASLPASLRKTMKDSATLLPEIKKYFESRPSQQNHLSSGELFTTSSGIEFRVMKVVAAGADGGDDGIVDPKQTLICCSGAPLEDITKITLLPIYETLPNREKTFSAKQILERYIVPHTTGLSVHVHRLGELCLNGVDFAITCCEPDSGIITCDTTITNEQANIRAGNWREKKMEEDEALARRLQGDNFPFNLRLARPPRSLSIPRNDNPRSGQPAGPTGQASGPPGPDQPAEPNAQVTRDNSMQMLETLLTILNSSNGQANLARDQGLSQIFRLGPDSSAKPAKPTAAHLASMLPTRKFKKSSFRKAVVSTDELKLMDESKLEAVDAKDSTEEDGGLKCRICLELYQEGDEVKTLPCFHIFHSACIDKWFQFSDECCICKTSVSGSFRNIPQGFDM